MSNPHRTTVTAVPAIQVIGEGRVVKIDFPLHVFSGSEVSWCKNHEPPVVFRLCGQNGSFLRIFDHREAVISAFRRADETIEDGRAFHDAFETTLPCLAGYRVKGSTQYIVLTDIGTLDMRDGGEGEALILTRGGCFNRQSHRVIVTDGKPAIHAPTKICLVEPRPPKTPK